MIELKNSTVCLIPVSLKVKRRQWKMELIDGLTKLTTAEPIPLPTE